jgi:hypothetical protein
MFFANCYKYFVNVISLWHCGLFNGALSTVHDCGVFWSLVQKLTWPDWKLQSVGRTVRIRTEGLSSAHSYGYVCKSLVCCWWCVTGIVLPRISVLNEHNKYISNVCTGLLCSQQWTFGVSWSTWNFLTTWATLSFSRRILLFGISP